ncbi:MAG: phenylalanine 4-monooxygenase [Pseudomonadota bacterium]
MGKGITYTAKQPNADGFIAYSDEEHSVWRTLYERQLAVLPGRACNAYLSAHADLGLSPDHVPQCREISERLEPMTGWRVAPVPALIPADQFFTMLANREFPAASFIRDRRELDYLEEPDIFHEVFGHAPHLTDRRFSEFTHAYGRASLAADDRDRELLARLYWFTAEFGLIATDDGPRAYGAGICSSPGETRYAVENTEPERRPFDVIDVLRTPFRIDTFQPIYYVLDSFDTLFDLAGSDLGALLRKARRLGDFTPAFEAA